MSDPEMVVEPALTIRVYAEGGLWADIPEMPGVFAATPDTSIPALLTSLKEAVVLWCKNNPQAPRFTPKGSE